MKKFSIIPLVFVCGVALGQSKNCKLEETKDSFTGKKKVITSNTTLFEKSYLLSKAFLNDTREDWKVGIAFWNSENDSIQLCVRHEGLGNNLSLIESIDIKFSDGSVIQLSKPKDGGLVHVKLINKKNEFDHYNSLFKITKDQLSLFSSKSIEKLRVRFAYASGDNQEAEKDIKSSRAQDVQKAATCILTTL